jgi:GT2 family glycosyltransferase
MVTVFVPAYNEERSVQAALRSVWQQDYPRERSEILVVDGMSTDGTVEAVRELQREVGEDALRVVANPGRTLPEAWNIALQEASGEVIAYVCAHSELAPDYLRVAVEALRRHGAAGVGGPYVMVGDGAKGEAIAAAMMEPFGVGASWYRYATEPGWAGSIPNAVYRRDVCRTVGLFDPQMLYGEDWDYNYRIRQLGGRLYLDPRIRFTFRVRPSLLLLWQQQFRFGAAKARNAWKHGPRCLQWHHLVPSAFIGVLGASIGLGVVCPSAWWVTAGVIAAYGAAVAATALGVARRTKTRVALLMPAVLPCMHVAYGVGFAWQLVRQTVSGCRRSRTDSARYDAAGCTSRGASEGTSGGS